jgi:polyisoprenoid-binding protein YceI
MSTTTPLPVGTYAVDPAHSNVGFEIRHMGIATVRGAFKTFTGTIDVTEAGLNLAGTVEVSSVDTGEANRDAHLLSPELFDAAQFPQISFSSDTASIDGEDTTLSGEITIKGVTQPIILFGRVAEGGEDPWGNQRIGFEVEATVDRTDFGVSFNQTLPNGQPLVANDVKLVVSVSAVKGA